MAKKSNGGGKAAKKNGKPKKATYTPQRKEGLVRGKDGIMESIPTTARAMGSGHSVMRATPEKEYGKPHGHIQRGSSKHTVTPSEKKKGAVRVTDRAKVIAARKKK